MQDELIQAGAGLQAPLEPTQTGLPSGDSPLPPSEVQDIGDVFPGVPRAALDTPLVKWVATGQPPGVRIPAGAYYPDLRPIGAAMPQLVDAGFDFYQSQNGDLVFYNPAFLPPEELEAMDQQGAVQQYLPEYGELTGQSPREMSDEEADEVLDVKNANQRMMHELGLAGDGGPQDGGPTASGPMPPPDPAAVGAINSQRMQGLANQSPTAGPAAGLGRITNAAIRPAV